MARIAGVDLPRGKRIEIGLTYIYGIGRSRSQEVLDKAEVDPDRRVHELTDDETNRLRHVVDSDYKVEGALRSQVAMDVKRLMDIGCYRGRRHKKGLPVRGQRTRTNARTHKGPRRTVAGRQAPPKR